MLRAKASLSWCSLYFYHTSFIYSNGPPISHNIHENHKAERVQTFFTFSVLIYNSSLLFFSFFFASAVDHELSKQCYCKMINTWSWHYVSAFVTNRGVLCDCAIQGVQASRHSHLFSLKMLIEYSYLISFMLMEYELIKFSY